uniref:Leucine-rich repeat-containing N-terminal plant-type domain-containing protein n=1 Tax=Populus alba TaxID=43335 RepID=A0A4U5QJJ8_POPAL|nr:hypothetical protein D5086_0000083870 [Populus alba]
MAGLLLQLLLTVFVMAVSLQGWLPLGCLEEERTALLQLKDALNYPNGTSLPSWIDGDAHCCSWESIVCNSSTGRVTILALDSTRNWELGDWYLNDSLFLPFQELNVLSLSANRIAGWVKNKGSSNLSALILNNITTYGSSLQLLLSLRAFPNLTKLDLSNNDFRGKILGFLDLKNLEYLDLSYNTLNNSIFQTIGNDFSGPLPPRFGTSSKLRYVYLSKNKLEGPIAMTFYNALEIMTLDLSHNDLTGRIPEWIDRLSNLRFLLLSYNNLEGEIPIRLCRNEDDISYNVEKIKGAVSPNLSKAFNLEIMQIFK